MAIDLDSTYLAFGRGDPDGDTNPCDAGVRFGTVLIPQGSTIHSAYVQVYASDTVSGATVTAVVRGEDADNANAFSTYANFTNRIKTSASAAWAAVAAWTFGVAYTTPSIVSIIQEIVNRPGWVSGNAIAIFVENNGSTSAAYREFAAYDHLTLAAAQLIVTFS